MLQIDNLTRYYGDFLALDHLNLTIGDGELHGFVGPNGAGKTTTMRILATLLPVLGRLFGLSRNRFPGRIFVRRRQSRFRRRIKAALQKVYTR